MTKAFVEILLFAQCEHRIYRQEEANTTSWHTEENGLFTLRFISENGRRFAEAKLASRRKNHLNHVILEENTSLCSLIWKTTSQYGSHLSIEALKRVSTSRLWSKKLEKFSRLVIGIKKYSPLSLQGPNTLENHTNPYSSLLQSILQ